MFDINFDQMFSNMVGADQEIIKIAEVVDTKQKTEVSFNTVDFRVGTSAITNIHRADLHFVYSDNKGVFIGALPPNGNPALTVMEVGNKYHGIQYYTSRPETLPVLEEGQLLLKNNDSNIINLIKNNIIFGNFENRGLVLNTAIFSSNNNFDHQFSFSQASRSIDGMIKREIQDSGYHDVLKLVEDDIFASKKTQAVSFISTIEDSGGSTSLKINKNPNFVENRKLVYEFEYSNEIYDLATELKLISNQTITVPKNNRHKSRLDVLGLSLTDPNYLIEVVEGNVVDIYGNLLDLNRYPIKTTVNSSDPINKTFLKLKEDQRRSLAYHFEINARKNLGDSGSPPDVTKNNNYARDRSRFYIDIDKEGQFKINVPASSEFGNIPLLTRYENYTTVKASKDSSFHPNETYFPGTSEKKIDILHDSFVSAVGPENKDYDSLKDKLQYNHGLIVIKKDGAEVSPLDRLSSNPAHVRHGTVYHDISSTCFVHQKKDFVDYVKNAGDWWDQAFVKVPIEEPIVSREIKIGENAGGRSGSINMDGSLELNIGANTADRQSIWLDTAGGMIANFGKDKNNISAAMSMDGQLLVQIGSSRSITKSQDSRFEDVNNAPANGALDIRVFIASDDGTGVNQAAVLRIDKNGIFLISPTDIHLQSNGDISINSKASITIEGEQVHINERIFEKAVSLGSQST